MGRASSSKRAARAARAAGRGKESKRTRSLAWPAAMASVVVLGGALIFFSVGDKAEASSPLLGDHWHAAYGVFVCGTFLPALGDVQQDVSGIHTHRDGLMHMHPFSTRYTGEGANLGALAEQVGMTLEDNLLQTPGTGPLSNDGGECGDDEPAVVQVKVWDGAADTEGRLLASNVADYAPPNGSLITIAFAPVGADLPKPPSAGTVPADVPGAGPVGGTVPPAPDGSAPDASTSDMTTPDTSVPDGSTPDTTATTAPTPSTTSAS